MKRLAPFYSINHELDFLMPSLKPVDLVLNIKRLNIYVYRSPIDAPVRTSFGTMVDRPAVLIRIEDGVLDALFEQQIDAMTNDFLTVISSQPANERDIV